MRPGILSVRAWDGEVTLTDGQVLPITNWINGEYDMPGPAMARTFVAGPDADGKWYAAALEEEDFDE